MWKAQERWGSGNLPIYLNTDYSTAAGKGKP